jgi:putative inorganic carbon (hco3(-)) transporter
MAFPLFIFLNALLLIRPEDLLPSISGLRLYLITIVMCISVNFPALQQILVPDYLRHRPITVCVLGLFLGTILSFVMRGMFEDGFEFISEFVKVILYFLLLMVVIDRPSNFRGFLNWIAIFVFFSVTIALLHSLDLIVVPGLDPVYQTDYDPETGEANTITRIVSCGLFNDPNDFAVILVFGMLLNFGLAMTTRSKLFSLLWLLTIPPSFYALTLTQSRGGMLALLGGVAATFFAKFGWKRSLPLTLLATGGILFAGSSRQSGIGGDTAHERLMLWAYGLSDLFRMPFHIFTGLAPGYYVREQSLLAHNSYINAYVELGIIGGGFFSCALFLGLWLIHKTFKDPSAAPWAKALGPYIFGAVASYAVGCYSLSRNFHIPTYLVIGIAASFVAIHWPVLPERYAVSRSWFVRLGILSVLGLVFLKFSTQLLGMAGI